MIDLISVDNMRLSDQATIASGVPGTTLMERAAKGIYLSSGVWDKAGSVCIVTGSGNNGGDGFALALILHDKGIPVSVFTLSGKASGDALYYKAKSIRRGIDIRPFEGSFTPDCDIIVDCLLGTGFKGEPREAYAQAIDKINELHGKGRRVISADINSGMNGDTGEYKCCVISDLTVSIGQLKKGQITPSALAVTGRLTVADIGIVPVNKEDSVDESEYGIDVVSVRD